MNTPFEKRICFTICICQLTAVLSCVSVVYLTVAIYNPAYKILNSGFIEKPVMCTTVEYVTPSDCDNPAGPGGGEGWNSCSEWCLSKSSGSCPRIMVDVRNNGSDIRLENCEAVDTIWCHGVDPNKKQNECYKGDCQAMHGLFNCTKSANVAGVTTADGTYGARCRELTSILECNITQYDEPTKCHKIKNCLDLHGLYRCNVGECSKVRPPFNCHKHCIGIKTGDKSVVIRQGDVVFSAQCARAVNNATGEEIWPLSYKADSVNTPPLLLMFCTTLTPAADNQTFYMSDCFNGTLMDPNFFGNTTDIKILQRTHTDAIQKGVDLRDENKEVKDHKLIGPVESDLIIYNYTRLYINYEGCVNTLILNECEKFYAEYGVDGADYRTQARYQCYYSPNSSLFASLRFNRMTTLLELMLATVIPFTLAIVSCFTLVLCTRIIHVGDDSHFYFQCCGADPKATLEKEQVEAMAL